MSSISEGKKPQVLILHAYSPNNSGDGLLVELAKKAVSDAVGEANIHVCASDASAFAGDQYLQWNTRWPRINSFVGRRIAMSLTGLIGPNKNIGELAKQADMILAVGGGYLRGGTVLSAFKSWGAHYGQLRIAAKYGNKSVYLSQSVGPFHGVYKMMVTRKLRQIHAVYLRDDRSVNEYNIKSVKRAPDMAVLELANSTVSHRVPSATASPVMVAREITSPRTYYDFLQESSESRIFDWALQSTGGANDDYNLTKKYGKKDPVKLKSILDENIPRIVVSTRLHGALSSLIAGYPAIHLSYERKGWGAYEDLGLEEFVVNARDTTLAEVEVLMQKITDDPDAFWEKIISQRDKIQRSYTEILITLRKIYEENSVKDN